MQPGKTIDELLNEIARQSAAKEDFLAPTKAIAVVADEDREPRLALGDRGQTFQIGKVAHEQLAELTKIPKPYYDRLQAEAPKLFAENVNEWLGREEGSRRLVRTLDGRARAVLSDSYRDIDNYDVARATFPVLQEHELRVISSQITERHFHLQVVSPKLQGEVQVGDIVQFGFAIRNSEVGLGAMSISELSYALWCKNGAVHERVMRKAHLGRRNEGDGIEKYLRSETREKQDDAFLSALRDTVHGMLTDDGFAKLLNGLREAAGRKIEADPVKVVEAVRKRHQLTEGERGDILRHLIGDGRGNTQWGLANAITSLAHDAADYDRAVELERIGARVIELKPSEWKVLHEEAEKAAA